MIVDCNVVPQVELSTPTFFSLDRQIRQSDLPRIFERTKAAKKTAPLWNLLNDREGAQIRVE